MLRRLVPVEPPYRLDLTVMVLRRSLVNAVDVVTPDGRYVRAFSGPLGPSAFAVRQIAADALELDVVGDPGEVPRLAALAIRAVGVERRTHAFDAGARATPWVATIAERMRGVRPPRYPTLWEAVVNAVSFQQISIHAAGAIVRRFTLAFGDEVATASLFGPEATGLPATLRTFPTAERILAADDADLRATGQSSVKVATLKRVAEALVTGKLDEAMLEERSTAEAVALLSTIKGVGPWTGTIVCMRGLGRLDVFPEKDSGLARSLRLVAGVPISEDEAARAIARLMPEQAMLYYHLLLAMIDARGELPNVFAVSKDHEAD